MVTMTTPRVDRGQRICRALWGRLAFFVLSSLTGSGHVGGRNSAVTIYFLPAVATMWLLSGALSVLLFAEVTVSLQPQTPPVLPEGLSIGPSQVLLPWMPPSYTLQLPAVRTQLQLESSGAGIDNGDICFYWAIQNPQVVLLLNPDCSAVQPAASCLIDGSSAQRWNRATESGAPCFSRVLVEAVPQPVPRRARSWIFASEETAFNDDTEYAAASDGQQQHSSRRAFRSQILVAPIVRLSFSTRDKRLAIGQLGDVSLLAYDAEGNVFSSLEGLPFYWEVQGEGEIVDVEPVAADAVAGTPARRLVEERGAQEDQQPGLRWRSDAVVLRGRSTGRATITARLAIAEYAEVPPATVEFLVHELVALTPSALIVPPAAVFYFRLLRLWEDGRQEAVSLPSRSYTWNAGDVSVFSSALGGLFRKEGEAAHGPSRLLIVTDGGVATARGQQQTEHGEDLLTGKAVVVCQDTRIEEKQQADVVVVLPTAIRLLYESTEVLPTQPLWKAASAAASSNSGSSKNDSAPKILLLRHLLVAEEPQSASGQGQQHKHLSSMPPLRLSHPPKVQRSGGGASGPGAGLLYLVQGREYLFKAELFSNLAGPSLFAGKSSGSEERERQMLLPSNAVLHWACDSSSAEEAKNTAPGCPLEKSVTSQQAYALFLASSIGDGLLRVSLMQVGSSPGEVWRSDPPLTASQPVRVVTPVFFRLLPPVLNPTASVGPNQQTAPRQLTAPLLLAPNTSFQLEPAGGSGEYVLSVSDPSICSVAAGPPRAGSRFSSSGLAAGNLASGEPATVYTLQAHAPGVISLFLRDRRQAANALVLLVVVAHPAAIELRVDSLLLPVVKEAKAAFKRQQLLASEEDDATAVCVAFADVSEALPSLPEATRHWLSSDMAGVGGSSSAPSSASASPQLSVWPQSLAAATKRLTDFSASTVGGSADGEEPRSGRGLFEEQRGGILDAEQAMRDDILPFVHPFWFSPTQLASCPEASFSLEGGAGRTVPPFTCGVASLRGVKKGAAQLTASLQQQGLHAAARLDAYLPLELWVVSSIPAFPPPPPSRLSSPRVATLLQRLTHPSGLNAASNAGSSHTAAAAAGAGAAPDTHLLDVQPLASAVSTDQSLSEEEALLYYGVPAATFGSSSSGGGVGVQGEVSLVVGGSISVFLKEGPPGRPEAYRHSLKATTEGATSTAAASEDEEESDTSVVAVVAAEAAKGGPTRVVCLRAGRLPAAVRFETLHESKYPAINVSRGETASLLISCGYPELLEVRVLPSLSQPLLAGEETLRAAQGAGKRGSLSPLALLTRKALGGAPVPAGTLAAAKTAPLSGLFGNGWEAAAEARETAAESLFVQCGALHVLSLFAFDAKLRPLLGLSGVPATWSLSPYSISQQQQHQTALDQQQRPLLELLPGSAVVGRAARALSASAGSLAALAVPASVCCGSFMLTVSISAPTGAPQGLKGALDAQQMRQLECSIKLWREASVQRQQQGAQLPLWHDGRLEDGLLLLLSPPLRLLPSPLLSAPAAAGQNPQGQQLQALRLFNHPAHYQRLLLQFGSPHVEAVRLLAASHKAGNTVAARGRPLLWGELLVAGSDSPLLNCLSPSQATDRYELLLKAEPSAAAATATDAACVGLPASSRDVLSASLPARFAFPSSPFSGSCPLSVREVFVSPPSVVPIQQQQQEGSDEPPVFLMLEASDPWMLSPWRPLPAFVDGSGSSSMSISPQLIARLQFVRLKSLRLALLPTPVAVPLKGFESAAAAAAREGHGGRGSVLPLCDIGEVASEAEVKGPPQGPRAGPAVAHIEAGKIFALRVDAVGEDDLPFGPAFFAAMRLSLFALPAENGSNTNNTSRDGISSVSATRGRVYLKTAQARQQQQQQRQQHVEQRNALPEGVSAVDRLMSGAAPLAVASYDPAAAAAVAAGEFAAPEGWQQLGSLAEDSADCAHFFVAAADMKGSFVLEAEAYTAAPPGIAAAGAAAGGGAAAVVPVTSRLTVEIHPPLELTPPHLVMLPGGHSFELTLQGGPEDAQAESSSSVSRKVKGDYERLFSVEDQRVAQLSEDCPGLLLTGEEGETRVSASLQQGRAGGRLSQAAMRVVVALPQSAAIITGLRRGGGSSSSSRSKELSERQARETQQAALLSSQASRLGYSRAAAAAAAAAASADDEGSIGVYANHVVPLQGALFDAAGRRFSHPHLLMPTGPLGGDGDGKHGEAVERQAKFGAVGSLPPSNAVACVFDWEVRSGEGAPRALLLSPLEIPLAEPPVHSTAAAMAGARTQDEEEGAGKLPLWSPADNGRRRLRSRGLAAVLLVGVEAGEARLSLSVSCFRHNKQIASVSAAEVFVRVLGSFAHEALVSAASPGLTGIASVVSSLAAPLLPPLLATEGVYLLPCCSVELLQLEGFSPSSAAGGAGLDMAGRPEQASLEGCCAAAAARATAFKDGDGEAAPAAAAEAATAAAACCEGVGGADCCEWSSTAATAAEAAHYAAFVLSGSKGFIASPLAGRQGVLRLSGAHAGGQQQLQQMTRQGKNTERPLQSPSGSSSLLLGIETARVESILLSPLVHSLNLGSSRDLQLSLRDARGRPLLSPSSLELEVASSHPAVVSVDVVTGSEGPLGPPAVRLRAHRRGCASVSVSLLSPATGLQASLQQQQEPLSLLTTSLRVCSESPEALQSPSPPSVLPGFSLSLLGGSRVPSLLLPATAALKLQLAFRASPVVAALNAWRGGPSDEVEGDTAAKAAAGAAAGMMPCLSQEQAATLLPQLSPQLRAEIQRLALVALQPSGAPRLEEPYFSPRVFVKSLHVQQLQHDRATSAAAATTAAASEGGAAPLCFLHAAGGTFEDGSTLIVADVHILDLAAAAAAAVSQQLSGSRQAETTATPELGTLDSLPAEWRIDGVLVLLQQLWRGLEREWRAALPAAASLLQDNFTLQATTSSLCRRGCPSWSFPLASFIAWDRGFGAVSVVSTSSSVSSRVNTRRSGRGSFPCKEFGGVRSSDPSSLMLIGSGSCGAADKKGVGLVAVATKETKEVRLLQHGALLATFEILRPAASPVAAGPQRRFRLLASVACGDLQHQLQQRHPHEEERWVAVEDLSLPRCRGAGGSQRGPMTIAFRAEALRLPVPLTEDGRGPGEERQARWEELPFVTPLFSSHLSISCRLVDPLLSRLFSVSFATVPSETGSKQRGGALSVANEKAEYGASGPSARPLCALTEKPRVSVQEVLPFLRSSLVARQTVRAEELVGGSVYTSGDCEDVVEALTKPSGSPLSLVITLSRTTSPLTLLQPQQQQQQQQQLLLPQQEVFLAHCMQWQGALPLRLLYDKTIMTGFAVPTAPRSSPDATVRIKPAKQVLRFVRANGSNSGKSKDSWPLVALHNSKGSSTTKWPMELHVFPVLTPANPEVRVSNDAFFVDLERQGPVLTIRLSPTLKTSSSTSAAAAAGDSNGTLMEWTAPEYTEVFVEGEADTALGARRLRVVLDGSGGRSVATSDPQEEEATFAETAAPPLLVCTLFACVGALACWLFCRSPAAAGEGTPSQLAVGEAAGGEGGGKASGAALKRIDGSVGGAGASYLTRSGRAARGGTGGLHAQPRRYDAPFVPVRQSATEPPSYTLQPNGAWQVSEPLVARQGSLSQGLCNSKASTRFYEG
ncbi:hypothetical protein Esti_003197 [Eimeria stiedai]